MDRAREADLERIRAKMAVTHDPKLRRIMANTAHRTPRHNIGDAGM